VDKTKVRFHVGKDEQSGKVHIVYQLDLEKVLHQLGATGDAVIQDLHSYSSDLEKTHTPLAKANADDVSCLYTGEPQDHGSQKTRADSISSSTPHSDSIISVLDVGSSSSPPGPKWPVFEHKSFVEYYSEYASRWLHAQVHVKAHSTSDFVYGVTLLTGKKQFRDGVPLRLLRTPMGVGEAVEVYIPDEGRWHIATIHKRPAPRNGRHIVYSVRTISEGGDLVFVRAPAHDVVRRFPEGCSVQVYRGAFLGWEHGTVLAELPEDLLSVDSKIGGGSGSENGSSCSEDRSMGDTDDEADLWTTVPVCVVDSENQETVLLVRSYLVRPCNTRYAACHVRI